MDLSSTAQTILKRHQSMVSARQPLEETYRDCYNHSHPLRAQGFESGIFDINSAKRKTAELYDSTSTDSAQILSSSIVNGTTPSNTIWFGLDAGQETEDEKRWLDDAANTLFENIHSGNFDSVVFECALDLVDAGYFGMFVDEAEGGGYQFEPWHPSEFYVASSKKGGRADIIHREYELTAEQCVTQFGEDNLSQKTRELAVKTPDAKVKLIHAIYPRTIYAKNAIRAKNLPIASCHIEVAEKKTVRESGYHEMPVIVPRWMLVPGSSYAVGQIFNALPTIKELNHIKKQELMNLDIAIAGTYVAVDDGILNPKMIKFGKRQVIVANDVNSIKPLASGTDFNVVFTKEEKLQSEIRRIMMADQMPPVEGQPSTATEFYARIGFLRQLLGPVFGRYNAEFLQPLITRCFGIAYRAGALGQAPESLKGREFSIKYLSPLARSQKMEEVSAIERAYAQAGLFAQSRGGDMSVFDNFDDDAAIRATSDALGVPNAIIKPLADVVKLREQKQAAIEEQQQQMQEAELAQKIIPDAAKTMMTPAIAA